MSDRPPVRLALDSGWQFKATSAGTPAGPDFESSDGWRPATVPGTVQLDLLEQGEIPDPFYGLNERDVQWVSETQWMYRLSFTPDASFLSSERAELHFEGLDTLCTVWLNGEQILKTDNMFLSHTVDVLGVLRSGENTLRLLFGNVLEIGHAREEKYGKRGVWNGDPSRVYVRKAQYHYGWDWGPVVLTAGPWKPITLRGYSNAIVDVHVPSEVTPDLSTAYIPVQVTLTRDDDLSLVRIAVTGPDGEAIETSEAPANARTNLDFELDAPQLWYPNGQGAQPLYTVTVTLLRDGEPLDERSTRIGLRRVRVIQEPVAGEGGTSFTFEVNNTPVFIGGTNWIPEDLLLNRVSHEQYRERLTQARDGNQNMIRVWGGGIYEADIFYDLCDELGLLVWQDFLFGCGLYPAHAEFLDSVREEAEQAVRRLRNHPALALWAGNNEDYAIAEGYGLSGPGIDPSRFDARIIYEGVLPDVVRSLDPQRTYRPGSPWGGSMSDDPTIGDRHSWEVWHGPMAPYQNYHVYQARFVSEFGMQSAPALSTLESCAPAGERYAESPTVVHHNKAAGPDTKPDGARRLAVYQADNLRAYRDLGEYVYNTQLVQAEAMRYAYRDFRHRFEGPGKYAVSGALAWQLNDCWPVSSWSIIDSYGIAKPAYYAIKREMAPLTVGLARNDGGVAVWLCSAGPGAHAVEIRLYAYTLAGELVGEDSREVRALPCRVTAMEDWTVRQDAANSQPLTYFASLAVNGGIVARTSDFPEPYKFYDFSDTGLSADFVSRSEVLLSAARPTKGVWLDAGVRVDWEDNYIDLRPGEPRTVRFTPVKERPIGVRALGRLAHVAQGRAAVPLERE